MQSDARPWFPKDRFKNTPIKDVIGDELHKACTFALGKLLEWSPDLRNQSTRILFPAIEGTGAYPQLTEDLRIEGENIWCVGDIAGKFRGIIPAFLSGYYVGRQVLNLQLENVNLLELRPEEKLVIQNNETKDKPLKEGLNMTKIGVGVMIVKDNQVLLGKRLSTHGVGTWSFPGGHLEPGEAPADCAVREAKEETGLEISDVVQGPWTSDVFAESGKHYITLFVATQYKGGTPRLTEPDKFQEWAWFSLDKLPSPLFKPIETLFAQGFNGEKLQHLLKQSSPVRLLNAPVLTTAEFKIQGKDEKDQLLTPFKIVSFDLDGTIVPGTTTTLHFAELLGVRAAVEKLEEDFRRGTVDSTKFMNEISVIMKGLTKKFIADNLHTLPIIGGLAETVARLKERGVITIIVTTSNQLYAEAVKDQYGFHHAFGTEFEINQDGSVGRGLKVCSSAEKIRRVKELTAKHGVGMSQVAAIGDSVSDIPLFSQVGLAIALNYEECLQGKAKIYLKTSDIREMIPHIFTHALTVDPHTSQNGRMHNLGRFHYMNFLRNLFVTLPSYEICAHLINDFDNCVDIIFDSNLFRKILPDDFSRLSVALLEKPLKPEQYKKLAGIFKEKQQVRQYFGEVGTRTINDSVAHFMKTGSSLFSKDDLLENFPKAQLVTVLPSLAA